MFPSLGPKKSQEIWLSVASSCFEKVGVSCTCFCINGHDFSARTIAERKLWLRAISNIKVKLQTLCGSVVALKHN